VVFLVEVGRWSEGWEVGGRNGDGRGKAEELENPGFFGFRCWDVVVLLGFESLWNCDSCRCSLIWIE
jgi:hypothetical protein